MSPPEEETDVFCFAHLLLQEFAAGKYIAEAEKVSKIIKDEPFVLISRSSKLFEKWQILPWYYWKKIT